MSATVVIDPRFRGPPDSGNGGYSCAMAAQWIEGPAEVTLRAPPPLGQSLRVEHEGDGVRLLAGEAVVAEARPAAVALDVPEPVSLEEARRAGQRYPWQEDHWYPTCFVCGPQREPGDGLRIFTGPVDDGSMYATVWVPDAEFADPEGNVRDEFVWAALDCPSSLPTLLLGEVRLLLLGRLTADLRAPLAAGEPYVVQAWPIGRDGRKLNTGSALFSAEGELCAAAGAVWIEVAPREAT